MNAELQPYLPTKAIDLIRNPPIAYAVLKKLKGDAIVFESISIILEKFCYSLNISKNMDKEQREECAELIYQKYWYWSPDHLNIAFRNYKMNKYPEIELYQSIDVTKIFQILDRFDKDLKRAKEIQENEELQAKYERWKKEAVPMPENLKSTFKEMINKKILNVNDELSKQKEEPEEWNLTKQWIEEFNEIWKNESNNGSSIRTITIENQRMTINDYLIYKLNNQ